MMKKSVVFLFVSLSSSNAFGNIQQLDIMFQAGKKSCMESFKGQYTDETLVKVCSCWSAELANTYDALGITDNDMMKSKGDRTTAMNEKIDAAKANNDSTYKVLFSKCVKNVVPSKELRQ